MKKILSVVLATLMLVSVFTAAFSASAFSAYDEMTLGISDIPNIWIRGQGQDIFDENGGVIYSDGIFDGEEGVSASDAISECMPLLLDAVTKGDWDAYNEKVLSIIEPVYRRARLDGNGDPQYGSHINRDYFFNFTNYNMKAANGKYAFLSYEFAFDWRLDPMEIAADLKTFIDRVKSVTGKDKVNVAARCEATNVLAAYIAEYGSDDLNCASFYVNTLFGEDTVSAVYSGNVSFNGEAVQRYLDHNNDGIAIEDDLLSEILTKSLALLVDTYSLDGATVMLSPVIQKFYQESFTKIIMASYGTMPGIWSLVNAESYARAKKYIFAGIEDEYAGLIEKLDNYDAKVRQRADEILLDAAENGVNIQFIGKYGDFPMKPVSESARFQNDNTLILSNAARGATVSEFGKILSKKYRQSVEDAGKGQYISPDLAVDCSTCLFPDTTWVVYNSNHQDFPACINEIIADFFASDGTMTVFNQEKFPQFLYCTGGDDENTAVMPMTKENGAQPNTEASHTKTTIREKFVEFLKMIIKIFKMIYNGELKLSDYFNKD